MSAGSVTGVYYIISRSIHDPGKARGKIITLTTLIGLGDTTVSDITTALVPNMTGFEDAVIASIAKREKADYIITRNEKDFQNSPVPAISPVRFLRQFTKKEAL
jgi:hypothetical protein